VGAVSAVNTALVLVGGCALVTAAIKVAGPVALGGRVMPAAFTAIVLLLAPALLAALVVTQALADGGRLAVGADTAGVVTGGLVAVRTGSVVAAVVVAAAVAAGLRAATGQ